MMAVPGNGTRCGSVPLDGIDAEHIAGLLASASAVTGAIAGDQAAEAACAGLGDWDDLEQLHLDLAIAAADLDELIGQHTAIVHP